MEIYEAIVLSVCAALTIGTVGVALMRLYRLAKIVFSTPLCGEDRFLVMGALCTVFPERMLHTDRAKAQMQEVRQMRMRTVVFATLLMCLFNGGIIAINILTGAERWWTSALDIFFVFMYTVALVVYVRPSLMTPTMCRLVFSVMMVMPILMVLPSHRPPSDSIMGEVMFGFRTFLSWGILDPSIVIAWNAVYSAVSFWQFVVVWREQQICLQYGVGAFAAKEFACFCILSALGSSCAFGVASEIRERLGAVASRNECGAVTSLLKAMSDVVVKLDATRRVMEHSPKLAALLLRGSSKESLRGASFERFMYTEDDKKAFHAHIDDKNGIIPDVAVPIRLRLRDGVGSCVTADLVHTEIEDVIGDVVHMVGIREVQAEIESADSVGKMSEWGADLPPLQPATMDAAAYLDALAAQPENYSFMPDAFHQHDRSSLSESGSRRSRIDLSSSFDNVSNGSPTFVNPVIMGSPTASESSAPAMTQAACRVVDL